MGILPMHEGKMPLKYWSILPSLSGPLGLGRAADTTVGGGTLQNDHCCGDDTPRIPLHLSVRCCPPRRHLRVLFLVHRLVVASTPLPLVLSHLLSAAVLLAAACSSSFLAAVPVVDVVDDDKDEEDDGVILSGVSVVVGIVPVVVVVDDDNEEEDDGIILSGISVIVGIIPSQQAIAVLKPSP
jgi:hypothetical protein